MENKEYCIECGEVLNGDVIEFDDKKFCEGSCFDNFIDAFKFYNFYEDGIQIG